MSTFNKHMGVLTIYNISITINSETMYNILKIYIHIFSQFINSLGFKSICKVRPQSFKLFSISGILLS